MTFDAHDIATLIAFINFALVGICVYLAEYRYKLARKVNKARLNAHMNELMLTAWKDMAKAEIEKNELLKEENVELKANLYEARQALQCEEKHRKLAEDILRKGEIA